MKMLKAYSLYHLLKSLITFEAKSDFQNVLHIPQVQTKRRKYEAIKRDSLSAEEAHVVTGGKQYFRSVSER